MNWKECGRKQLLLNRKQFPNIFFRAVKTT